MPDEQDGPPNVITPLSKEVLQVRASLASRGLRDISQSHRLAALEAIHAIIRNIVVILDLDELLTVMCNQISGPNNWLRVDHVAVLLAEHDRPCVRAHEGRLTVRAEVGDTNATVPGLAARALTSQRSIAENDLSCTDGYVPFSSEALSEMCVPLIFFGESLGVLILDCSRKNAFAAEDMELVESLADICAAVIQAAEYFDRMRRIAYEDFVTGVHSRRFFEMRIGEELERAQRFKGRMSVGMVSVDHFRALNDDLGSGHCEEILRSVAAILKQQLRKMDCVCRYSEAEFAILIPETSGESALRVADKLRHCVENHSFPGMPKPVTISCGMAEFPRIGTTRDELVTAAEEALEVARQGGRNKVVLGARRE